MSPQEFERTLQLKSKEVQAYAMLKFPTMAGNKVLRFIDGNFRAQGFQGSTFKRWKPSKGTILVKTGALRAANYYTTQPGQVTVKNSMPYAKMHNNGFKGTINIKAHSRNSYGKIKAGTGRFTKKGKERTQTLTIKTGESQVKAHSRKIDLKQRQFTPTSANDSPTLNQAIQRQVANDIKQIMGI